MSKLTVKAAANGLYELHQDGQCLLYGFNDNAKTVLQDIAEAVEKGGLKTAYAEVHQFKREGYFLLKPKAGLSIKIFQAQACQQDLLNVVTQVKRTLPTSSPKVDKTPVEPT